MGKPILYVDFDGVVHSYESGRKGAKIKVTDAMKAKITADLGRTGKRAMKVADIAKKYGIAASTIYTLFPGGKHRIINGKAART